MPISDFRKKKLLYVFNVFFDVNQSGTIDKKDFELAIEKICTLRGWPVGHAKNKETHETMIRIWEGLRSKADKDNDGQNSQSCSTSNHDTKNVMNWKKTLKNLTNNSEKWEDTIQSLKNSNNTPNDADDVNNVVSVDEWCNMWDAYAKDPSAALDWQQRYMQFMFDLEDASTDGTIDAEEFSTVCSSYGIDKNECKEAFKKMSKGAAEVNREQFAVLWKDYFASEDSTSAGNFIFGKTSF